MQKYEVQINSKDGKQKDHKKHNKYAFDFINIFQQFLLIYFHSIKKLKIKLQTNFIIIEIIYRRIIMRKKRQRQLSILHHISNLALQQTDENNQREQIKKLFAREQLSTFNLRQLMKVQSELQKDQNFILFLKVLEKWNKAVYDNKQQGNKRTQYSRNQHIYSMLSSLLFQPYELAKVHLVNLFTWYSKNCENTSNFGIREDVVFRISQKSKTSSIDQDDIIRDNFKSNMPLQINNYRRKLLINEQKEKPENEKFSMKIITGSHYKKYPYRKQSKTNNMLLEHKKMLLIKQQKQLIKKRELQQAQFMRRQWKKKKARFQQQTCKNFYKTTDIRTQPLNKSLSNLNLNDQFYKTNNTHFEEIKRTKLNKTIGFKSFYPNTTTTSSFVKSQVQQILNDCLEISSIDGLKLISNPFQVKVAKIKRVR